MALLTSHGHLLYAGIAMHGSLICLRDVNITKNVAGPAVFYCSRSESLS